MKTRICFGIVSLLLIAFVSVAFLSNSSSRAADEPQKDSGDGYKLVAPLDALMEVMEGNVFKGILEQAKAGKFKDIKREGYFLAEFANLTSHEKEHKGKKEWAGFCDAMKAGALKLVEAAEKKDEAGVKTQHAALEKTCDACHEKFRDN